MVSMLPQKRENTIGNETQASITEEACTLKNSNPISPHLTGYLSAHFTTDILALESHATEREAFLPPAVPVVSLQFRLERGKRRDRVPKDHMVIVVQNNIKFLLVFCDTYISTGGNTKAGWLLKETYPRERKEDFTA